jgi:hypothetical protein
VRKGALAHVPPYDPNFFLVMDRLYDILEERLRKWRGKQSGSAVHGSGFSRQYCDLVSSSRQRCAGIGSSCRVFAQSWHHARQLETCQYCVLCPRQYQDFDFGLARRFPPCTSRKSSDERNGPTYHFSKVGSLRYMSPEVILGRTYNKGVDVYSMSLIV